MAEVMELDDATLNELREGRLAQLKLAERQQIAAARIQGTRRHMKSGEVQMQIHPQFYHYWGQRLGYDCWKDKQFVHEFLRDNPEARIKSVSRKIMVGYNPTPDRVKFHKTYDLTEKGKAA